MSILVLQIFPEPNIIEIPRFRVVVLNSLSEVFMVRKQ